MIRWVILILILCGSVWASSGTVDEDAGTIEQWGITWTFDKDLSTSEEADHYQYGTYITGEYWVRDQSDGTVVVSSISPATATGAYGTDGATRTINGSMLDPVPGLTVVGGGGQGYDSAAFDYVAATNVGDDCPLTITTTGEDPIASLLSSQYLAATHVEYPYTKLQDCAILTVVYTAPAANSFRPSYCPTRGTQHTISDIQWATLASLPPVTGTPSFATQEAYFTRSWIPDHLGNAQSRSLHPVNNMQDYARELTDYLGKSMMLLNLNYTQAEKDDLLYKILQCGIDYYGIVASGGYKVFIANGGHGYRAKLTILFTGTLLNDASMTGVGAKSGDYLFSNAVGGLETNWITASCPLSFVAPPVDYIYFQEDGQTFYITQDTVDLTSSACWSPNYPTTAQPFTAEMIGLAEWGVVHDYLPQKDDSNWTGLGYRNVSIQMIPLALTARIMGLYSTWNHPAFFDYIDRYVTTIEADPTTYSLQVGAIAGFTRNMWDEYRDDYGEGPTAPILTSIGSKSVNEGSALEFTVVATGGTPPYVYSATYLGGALPTGATLTDDDFAWTPGATQSGVYNITFTVTDDNSETDSEIVTITVNDSSDPLPPVLAAITKQNGTVGQAFSKTCTATDETSPADTLTWSATGLPSWASLNTGTGAITGTPTQPGTWYIWVTVSDGTNSDTEYFLLEVRTGGPVYGIF